MTRSQKPGNNAASARDRVPADVSTRRASRQRHGVTPCAARTREQQGTIHPGGGGTDCRDAAARRRVPHAGAGGSAPQAEARRCQRRHRRGRAIEMSSGGRTNSLRIRRVAAYTAHSSVASPESRTTSAFGRGRKKRQDGGSRVRAAEYLMPGTNSGLRSSSSAHPRRGNHTQRNAPENAPPPHFSPHNTRLGLRNVGRTRIRLSSILPRGRECPSPKSPRNPQAQGKQRRPPDDAGNKRRRGGNNRRRRNGKVTGHKRRREKNNRRRPPGARQAMFRRIHPALLLKQTRRAPRFRSPETGLAPCPAQKKAFRKTEVLQNA